MLADATRLDIEWEVLVELRYADGLGGSKVKSSDLIVEIEAL